MGGTLDITVLYRRYGDMVLGRCRSLLGNDADAQDATQEVFLQLHRYRDRFRWDAKPSTYLYRAATNVCLNRLRSKRRRPEDPVAEMPYDVGHDGLVPALELRQVVTELLADQDERTVQCVVYHFMDGMTHDEVGTLLGISGAAVRKRIAKFRNGVQDRAPAWLREDA